MGEDGTMIARWHAVAVALIASVCVECGGRCDRTDLVGTFKVEGPPEPYLASAEMTFAGDQMTVTYIRDGIHFTVIYRLVDEDFQDSSDSSQ